MAFLTGWRPTLAADLLLEPGAALASGAAQVGYGTPFALSTAFKRVRGVSRSSTVARSGRRGGQPKTSIHSSTRIVSPRWTGTVRVRRRRLG
jgi:AraC-like DNA-binding protein